MTSQTLIAPITRIFQGLSHAMQRMASRRELSQLDDRMLQDLGISRAQADYEAHRAPWHDAWH